MSTNNPSPLSSSSKPHLLHSTPTQMMEASTPVSVSSTPIEEVRAAVTPEAAEAFIENKRLGDRIKFLRQRKGMGLVELGRHTGLSASFLSQLETGRVVPTLRNLARIAMVFSKDLSFFFQPERPELFRVVRAADRQLQPQTGVEVPTYFFESLGQIPGDNAIAPYVAKFLPQDSLRPVREHQHSGSEFIYILSGKLNLTHSGRSEVLEPGDAVYFSALPTHSYRAVGSDPCQVLILTVPEPGASTYNSTPRLSSVSSTRVARGSAA